jgi:TonB family protein
VEWVSVIIRAIMANDTVAVRLRLVAAVTVILCVSVFPAAFRVKARQAAAPAQADTTQGVPPANGLADASGLVADALVRMKAKSVAIFDFYSPGDTSWDAIGKQIAADVRTRVGSTRRKLKLTPYSNIEQWIERDHFWQTDLSIADVGAYILRDDKADAFVTGSLTTTESDPAINVRMFVYKVGKPGPPSMITTSIPFSLELKAMVAAPEPTIVKLPPYKEGNGVHYPRCIYCPQAGYTDKAVHEKLQGVVTLSTIIEPNGKAGPIRVIKGLAYGLDASAVSAVREWRFETASGPDGKPVAVEQTIEVQFHLY